MHKADTPAVVCLGFFDGVHRGHLALLEAAGEIARKRGWPICVHTFDRAPGNKGQELTTLAQKEALLRRAGADRVAVSVFDDHMRMMPGDAFIRDLIFGELQAGYIICGDDHRFGHKGAWGVNELKELCREAGVGITVVPEVTLPSGQRISSSAIRKALSEGNTALAEEMLGRSGLYTMDD